jgi:hypothetical protein
MRNKPTKYIIEVMGRTNAPIMGHMTFEIPITRCLTLINGDTFHVTADFAPPDPPKKRTRKKGK